jgi:hypothetical protein
LKNYWEGRGAGHGVNVGNFQAGQPTGFYKVYKDALDSCENFKLMRNVTFYSLYTIIYKDIRSLRFFVVPFLFVTLKK